MGFIFKEFTVFNRKIPLIAIIWFVLAFVAALSEVLHNKINNYLIFKYIFWHVIEQNHLYAEYPLEYFDVNHYGPTFSALIAPFAILPNWIACILWGLFNAGVLYYAIIKLDLDHRSKLIIVAITAIEMMTAIHNMQFNPTVAAWLILAYLLVEKEKDFWATLFIAAGFLIKLYGIAGLLFFVFSKHKFRFVLSFLFWTAVLFCLPMLYSSTAYILDTYKEWFEELVIKNDKNASGFSFGGLQDISVMGMVRRITQKQVGELLFLAPAALMILLPLLRFKQYASKEYRLSYLAIVLISVVIFSSSAEPSTYVIAVPGACLWYLLHRKTHPLWSVVLLILLFLLTILSPTDLIPEYIRVNIIRAYALKALPCFIIWLWLIADVAFKNFLSSSTENRSETNSISDTAA